MNPPRLRLLPPLLYFPPLRHLIFIALVLLSWLQPVVRAQGQPAPAPKHTLILSASSRAAYGLRHDLEFLRLQLQRIDTHVASMPLSEDVRDHLAAATHLVVFCPEPNPSFPTNLLQQLRETRRPVLWVGYGVGEARLPCPVAEGMEPVPAAGGRAALVTYRGREWGVDESDWIPIQCQPAAGERPRAEANIASAPALSNGLGARGGRPLITVPRGAVQTESPLLLSWQSGSVTVFSAVPRPGLLGFLFSDLLLDFFEITNAATARVALRIDDYEAGSDHYEFQTKVDLLAARGVPFLLSVAPSWRLSPTGAVMTLDEAPEYVESLRQAQARGGRLLVRGCVREPGEDPEFWNGELDRPNPESPERIREQLHQAVGLMLKHGLLPVGWQTPHDAASRSVYREVAQVFSMAMERPQLSDLSGRETALLSAIVRDRDGREIIPENLGFVLATERGTNGLAGLRRRVEILSQLRDTIAGAYFHAYLPQDQLLELLGALEAVKKPFLDVLKLDQWVHVPGRLLLTGRAEHRVQLAGGIVQWRAFDRTGQELQSEQVSLPPGERLLQRKGRGDYELYEFKEGTQP